MMMMTVMMTCLARTYVLPRLPCRAAHIHPLTCLQKPKATKKKPVAVAKKAAAKKPEKVAKTQLVFEVKPEEADTDLKKVEADVRAIAMDGLNWGEEFGTVPVGYGINKLVVQCVIEDEKVSVDDLEEAVQNLDGVQSTDMVAMNKM